MSYRIDIVIIYNYIKIQEELDTMKVMYLK